MIAKKYKSALIASAAILAIPLPTQAQPGPAMGGPGIMGDYGRGGFGPGWHMWGGPGAMWGGSEAMASRIDGRLAFLKAELKITSAQQGAWDKVAVAVRASAKSMTERMQSLWSTEQKAKTLPERLDIQEKFISARLDEVRALKSALKDLYEVLGEDQKKEADTLVLPMMGMGMMAGGGGMGPGMWRR